MNVVRMLQSKAKGGRGRHERGVGPEQKGGEPRGAECPRVGSASRNAWPLGRQHSLPAAGSQQWEPSGYNLRLPDFYLGGSSLISREHLLQTSRRLPIGHPVRGKPFSALCVPSPHPTQKSWTPINTAPSQGCGVLKGMGCWGRKSPHTHFTPDRTEPRCSFPQDSREECASLLCSPLFHSAGGPGPVASPPLSILLGTLY